MVTAPKIQIPRKKKIAFALSGGGTKAAAFHIGVAFALQERGFEFYSGLQNDANKQTPGPFSIQTYIGSSAGSFIASILAAGYGLENITNSFIKRKSGSESGGEYFPRPLPKLNYQKMFRLRPEIALEQAGHFLKIRSMLGALIEGKMPSILQLRWLKLTGLFSTQGVEQFLREEVLPSNRFEDYRPELFIVGTKLNESRKVVFGKNEYPAPPHDPTVQYQTHVKISDAVAASTSLPVLFSPYPITDQSGGTHYYTDGEIRETLSTHVAVDAGADLVFTSYTHQPYRMAQGMPSLMEQGLSGIVLQSIYVLIEQKINSVFESYRSKKGAMNEVFQFCKDENLSPQLIQKIMDILELELHQKRSLDIIPIHPDPMDSRVFFAEHFSLNSNRLSEVLKSGYRAAKQTLDRYEFER